MSDSNTAILESYKDCLAYRQTRPTLLCCRDALYEYNRLTHKLRPLNSVLWYPVYIDQFKEFIDYIDSRLSIIEQSEPDADKPIYISLNKIEENIVDLQDASTLKSFCEFLVFIDRIYTTNHIILSYIIEQEIHLL